MVALALIQYGSSAVITAILHPFGYAKVLMQVGHEPLPPEKTTTFLFRREVFEYPNIFRYIAHIKSVDGITGLYRGVVPRVLAGTVGNFVQFAIHDRIKSDGKKLLREAGDQQEADNFALWLKRLARETSEDTVSRCCGVVVSHPFQVIMVRSMVQFIGRETKYNSILSSMIEIYNHDGVMGFFVGLVPRLIGEIITIWATSFLVKAAGKYFIQEKEMKSYTGAACSLVVSHFAYPFTLVTNVMAVSNSGLAGGQYPIMPEYSSWTNCMRCLSTDGDLKRGSNAFWRVYKPRPVCHSILTVVDSAPKLSKHK